MIFEKEGSLYYQFDNEKMQFVCAQQKMLFLQSIIGHWQLKIDVQGKLRFLMM